MFKATIAVTLRPSILDPQGKTTEHALHNLGYEKVEEVRVGKHIEVSIDVENREEAQKIAEEACEKVLSNPVMEDYSIELTEVAAKSS